MKTAENGPEFERAYDTLELPVNASREAVEQSYNDLRKVWAPERFQADERLKRRAEEQLARIEEAYLLLKDRHSRQDPLLEELYGKGKKIKPRSPLPPKTETRPAGMPPSLADTVFAEPASRSSKRFPVGLVVTGILVIIVLGIFVASRLGGNGSPSGPKSGTPAAPNSSPPSVQAVPPAATDAPSESVQSSPASPTEGLPGPSNDRVESRQTEIPPEPTPVNRGPKPRTEPEPAKPKPSVRAVNPAPSREPVTTPELVRGPEEGGVAPEEERRVMNVLGQKSPAAQSILEGTTDQFQVMSWRVTKKDGGEFWAHLVAHSRATGTPTHFIWAVDPGKEIIRPMSQAARDLEKGSLGRAQTGS